MTLVQVPSPQGCPTEHSSVSGGAEGGGQGPSPPSNRPLQATQGQVWSLGGMQVRHAQGAGQSAGVDEGVNHREEGPVGGASDRG